MTRGGGTTRNAVSSRPMRMSVVSYRMDPAILIAPGRHCDRDSAERVDSSSVLMSDDLPAPPAGEIYPLPALSLASCQWMASKGRVLHTHGE